MVYKLLYVFNAVYVNPLITAASAAFSSGTNTFLTPFLSAVIAIANIPARGSYHSVKRELAYKNTVVKLGL